MENLERKDRKIKRISCRAGKIGLSWQKVHVSFIDDKNNKNNNGSRIYKIEFKVE